MLVLALGREPHVELLSVPFGNRGGRVTPCCKDERAARERTGDVTDSVPVQLQLQLHAVALAELFERVDSAQWLTARRIAYADCDTAVRPQTDRHFAGGQVVRDAFAEQTVS